jgi:hypothetical protein
MHDARPTPWGVNFKTAQNYQSYSRPLSMSFCDIRTSIRPRHPDSKPEQMANELRKSESAPDPPEAGHRNHQVGEPDPDTWYGLVWRIVRTAMESNAKLIRVSILVILLCVTLVLIARAGGLSLR